MNRTYGLPLKADLPLLNRTRDDHHGPALLTPTAWGLPFLGVLISLAGTLPQLNDPLDPIAFLPGGTWVGKGAWPDGSPLHVEVRYFWGPTRRVVHFRTDNIVGGERQLLYEGLMLFDQRRQRIVQWNIKANGEVTEQDLVRADTTGFEMRGQGTWSVIRRTTADEFRWELRVPRQRGWAMIMDAHYQRSR